MKNKYITPKYLTREDIVAIRKKFRMTQSEFASFIGTSTSTIERWETQDGKITGPVCLAVHLLQNSTNVEEDFKIPEKNLPTRMWYMCGNLRCTLIDVDETRRIVRIKNYTSDIMRRAFGKNVEPTFDEYENFLRSRCFPETRDNLKAVLNDLSLPFYDPFLIVKKTKGKMSEDNFWIDIEG